MSYMTDVDAWLTELLTRDEEVDDQEEWLSFVKKEIKNELLDSYRRGQKAGLPPEKPREEKREPRPVKKAWGARGRGARQ